MIFEDAAHPGRLVQIGFGDLHDPIIEATNQNDGQNHGLSPTELRNLLGLGFVDQDVYPSRNIDLTNLDKAAELVDTAFLAIGASPDFDVAVFHAQNDDRSWADGA